MVCSNISTDSNDKFLNIRSLLNPLVEGPSASPIVHYEGPPLTPNQSFVARYSASHHSCPAPTCSWSNPEALVGQQADGRRSIRERYTEEESTFIWYHRVDLGLDWRVVLACFNTQFPDRQRSPIHSIQCALYRFMKQKNCPSFRTQDLDLDQEVQSEHYFARQRERASRFGVIACAKTGRYPWMRESPYPLLSAS